MHQKKLLDQLPMATAVHKRMQSLPAIWIIPLIAAGLGIWLATQAVMKAGPTVTLTFESAEGLEAGKTKIRYKNVDIGDVKEIALSKDRTQVIVTAEFVKDAEDFLVEDTQFWVVRPRISAGEVSGIGTLFSGSYISLKVGESKILSDHFTGLEAAPILTSKLAGKEFMLSATDMGSLDIGSPIYYRHIRVGEVIAFDVDPNGHDIHLRVFIHAPFQNYVNRNTRFWNASGVDASMDSKGVQVETESLISILAGGIAFESPGNEINPESVTDDQVFPLFKDRLSAMKTPSGKPQTYVMYFNESLRGLVPGSSVEFQGIPVGQVRSVAIRFDENAKTFSFPVTVEIYEDELGLPQMYMPDTAEKEQRRLLLASLIARGFRGQLRSGSLITGQLYVALEFFPDCSTAKMDWNKVPLELPTTPGTVQAVEQSVTSILKKIDRMPLDDIGLQTRNTLASLNATTQNLNKFMERLNKDIAPEAQGSLSELKKTLAELKEALEPNSPLQRDLRKTLKETTRSAQTIRDLADTLEAEPESLIKGKKSGDNQ
ncbi:MAG: hypothetical protein RLZ25_886 [Pseudomonadota bacterium]|jgi:paraquat-inducible protein B